MAVPALRIGIAGANPERGWARDAHLPALSAIPGLVVHAVSARTAEIADAALSTFSAAKAFDDSLAMARDPNVDIVAVTVKVPEHRAIVLAALEAGKHVYCEWPLARGTAEAEELAAAARAAGTHVAIGLQGANAIAVRHAAELVRQGALGDPLNLRVVSSTAGWGAEAPPHYAYLQDPRNGATLASIAGGHTLAMVEAVVGRFIEIDAASSILQAQVRISGSDRIVDRHCADHILIRGRHAGGCISSIEIVGGDAMPLRFELRGTSGKLSIEGSHPGGYQCADLVVVPPAGACAQPAPPLSLPAGNPANVGELWRRFENDIRTGSRTVPDFERAVELHRLLDQTGDPR